MTATDNTKKCPFCAEEILAEAIKCKHCGERVSAVVPPAPVVPAPQSAIAVAEAAAPASAASVLTAAGEQPAPAPALPSAKPKKWVSGSEWWYFAPVPLFLIGGCPGLAAALAAGAIALKTTRNATTKQQKIVVAGLLYCIAAVIPVALAAKMLSGDLFRQSVEVVQETRAERTTSPQETQSVSPPPPAEPEAAPAKNQREERCAQVFEGKLSAWNQCCRINRCEDFGVLSPKSDLDRHFSCLNRCASKQGTDFAGCYDEMKDRNTERAGELRGMLSEDCLDDFMKRNL